MRAAGAGAGLIEAWLEIASTAQTNYTIRPDFQSFTTSVNALEQVR